MGAYTAERKNWGLTRNQMIYRWTVSPGDSMSQKIADVLDVLTRIRRGYRPGRPESIREARIGAIHVIADERGVTHQTIGDAYLRRLEPDVKGTPAFDRLVWE